MFFQIGYWEGYNYSNDICHPITNPATLQEKESFFANTISQIKASRIKNSLAKGEDLSGLSKKRDGISSDEYRILYQAWNVSKNNGRYIHQAFTWLYPLWEQERGIYLQETLRHIGKIQELEYGSAYLMTLFKLLHAKKEAAMRADNGPQREASLKINEMLVSCLCSELEHDPVFLSATLREALHNSPTAGEKLTLLEQICSLVQTSPILTKEVISRLTPMLKLLPQEAMIFPLGDSTLGEELQKLARGANNSHELLQCQILEKLGISPATDILITEKELALVLGDSFIAGSGFEGYASRHALNLLSSIREALPPNLQADLQSLIYWNEKISLFRHDNGQKKSNICLEMADHLKKNRRLVSPAGWYNAPTAGGSHAMVVEARLLENEKASIRLYNQGAGVSNHQEHIQPFRLRRSAYLEIDQLPEQIATSPSFWMVLMGFVLSLGEKPEPYQAIDLYSWFQGVLPGNIKAATTQGVPHQAGTCAFQSIHAFFKSNCSEEEYDRFILRFKVAILVMYERDLHYRRQNLDLFQKKFLGEIRKKMRHSITIHLETDKIRHPENTGQEAGRIDEELANLLIRYCEPTNLQIPTKKENLIMPVQLSGVFSPEFYRPLKNVTHLCETRHMQQQEGIASLIQISQEMRFDQKMEFLIPRNHKIPQLIEATARQIQTINDRNAKKSYNLHSSHPRIESTRIGLEEKGAILLQLFHQLPPLEALKLKANEEVFMNLFQLMFELENLTFLSAIGGIPTVLLLAWFSEFITILATNTLSLPTDAGHCLYDFNHFTKAINSAISSWNQPLSSLGEHLLHDWSTWCKKNATYKPIFSIKLENVNGGAHLTIAPALDCQNEIWLKSFESWFDKNITMEFSSFLMKSKIGGLFFPSKKSPVFYLMGCIKYKIEKDFNIILNEWKDNGHFMAITCAIKLTRKKIFSPSLPISEHIKTLPFVGIEQELSVIEEKPVEMARLLPDERWFTPCLILQENALERGIPVSEWGTRQKTPWGILLHSPQKDNYLNRLQNFLQQKIIENLLLPLDVYLCCFRLAAKINLRAQESNFLTLMPSEKLLEKIFSSPPLMEAWSLYCLSQPIKPQNKELILKAYYYLLAKETLRQNYADLSLCLEFFYRIDLKKLEELVGAKVALKHWHDILKMPILNIPNGFEIQQEGKVFYNQVFQVKCNRWQETAHGKMLNSLLGGVSFGPWIHSVPPWDWDDPPTGDQKTMRRWENNGYIVEEWLEGSVVLCNGAVLQLRLKTLGLASHGVTIEPSKMYEICPTTAFPDLPTSMLKGHLELWNPICDKSEGIIIDIIDSQCYKVKRTKGEKTVSYSIFRTDEQAQLLAGKVNGEDRLFFTWCKQTIRIPHLGQSSMEVSIWASGRSKQAKFWVNCMNGALKFKVERCAAGGFEYISEQYEGFKWIPDYHVAELGLMHGIYLRNSSKGEECLIIPLQKAEMANPAGYRPVWKNSDEGKYGVLSRKLHPAIPADDPAQARFTCKDPLFHALILRELVYQRDWERAFAYIFLIPNLSAETASQLAPLFVQPRLDYPEARVIRLRLLTHCAAGSESIDSVCQSLGYLKNRLKNDYMNYIRNYHQLNFGYTLNQEEEKAISQWIDPCNPIIASHLERALGTFNEIKVSEPAKTSITKAPIPTGNLAPHKPKAYTIDFSSHSWECNPPLRWIYRPIFHRGLNVYLRDNLLDPTNLSKNIIRASLLWFALREYSQTRNALSPLLKILLERASTTEVDRIVNPVELLREELRSGLKTENISSMTLGELTDTMKEGMKAQGIPIALDPMPVEDNNRDTRSLRQRVRQTFLNRRLFAADQSWRWVERAIEELAFLPLKNNEESHLSGRKRKDSVSSIESRSLQQQIETLSSRLQSASEREKLVSLFSVEIKNFVRERENLMLQIHPLFTTPQIDRGAIGLHELFGWIDQLDEEPQVPEKKAIAEILVNLAEVSAVECTLKGMLAQIESHKFDKIDLEKGLNIGFLGSHDFSPTMRYRLATFMWRHQMAFRPEQLQIFARVEKSPQGILVQADCGAGKSFAISPAICSFSKHLVFNVVPPGIAEEDTRVKSKSSSSWKGVPTNYLPISRENISVSIRKIAFFLTQAEKMRTPIVLTVSDIASLFLRYYELGFSRVKQLDEYGLLEKILKNFKNRNMLLLDEIDVAAKEQIHWPVGAMLTMKEVEMNMVHILYKAMCSIDHSREQKIFCLEGRQRFSLSRYEETGVPLLIENLVNHFSNKLDKEWLKAYFAFKRGGKEWQNVEKEVNDIVKKMPSEGKALIFCIQTLRSQLHVYLPHTLKMRYNVHYGDSGLSGESAAVPFKSAHCPDPKSRFTDTYIQANLTVQGTLQKIPSNEEVIELVKKALKDPDKEGYVARWLGRTGSLANFFAIIQQKEGYETYLEMIKQNLLARMDLAVMLHLPKIKLNTQVLSFTMASLTAGAARPIGLTATPNNRAGMNGRLATNFLKSDAYETTEKIFNNSSVMTCPADFDHFLQQCSQAEDVHALIDPNALLVDYTNEEVAIKLIEMARTAIKHVVYWDIREDRFMAMNRSKRIETFHEKRYASNDCFFYFDQTRSRGIDLPLPNCKIEVLVGEECTFTTLKQATERGRRIKEGLQIAQFWMENELNPSPTTLLHRLKKNEQDHLAEELSIMARREMEEVCNQRLTERIWEQPDQKTPLLKAYGNLRLHPIDHLSAQKYAGLKPLPSIADDLLTFENKLFKQYEQLITDEDRKEITACRLRVVQALGDQECAPSKPIADFRAEIIISCEKQIDSPLQRVWDLRGEVHHQKQVQNRVQLEKEKMERERNALWAPRSSLAKLQALSNPGPLLKILPSVKKNREVKAEWAPFYMIHASEVFSRLVPPSNLSLSKKVIFSNGKENYFTEEQVNKLPAREAFEMWKSKLSQISHLLTVVPKENAPHRHFAISCEEADQVAQHIGSLPIPSHAVKAELFLHKMDGGLVASSNIANVQTAFAIEGSVLATVAIFNGTLGKCPPAIVNTLEGGEEATKSRLAFLSDRLRHYRPGHALEFNKNPLVHALKAQLAPPTLQAEKMELV